MYDKGDASPKGGRKEARAAVRVFYRVTYSWRVRYRSSAAVPSVKSPLSLDPSGNYSLYVKLSDVLWPKLSVGQSLCSCRPHSCRFAISIGFREFDEIM
ncbi:hypothetical protein J6590_022588 [Homalodisca vitripennis]|nr:hypothetical protein J6590_022588 [Homalodisca vitripennis]